MQLTVEATFRTLFVRIGRTAEVWLERRSWVGWKPFLKAGKGGATVWWMWWEMSFAGRRTLSPAAA